MEFHFTNEYKSSSLDEIVTYLAGPRLWIANQDYPDYFNWLQKVHEQLRHETKRALVAFENNRIVGVSVYQLYPKDKDFLEIKNLTIRPEAEGRYIASFLLRNTEIEGSRDFNCHKIICDSKFGNLAVRSFLCKHHYRPREIIDLYGLKGGEDIVYTKDLKFVSAGFY
jgi:hypothetical protein